MESKVRSVSFYVMRHGRKNGDALTPAGEEDVRRATKALLSARGSIQAALYSGMNRTRQTMQIALQTLGIELEIRKDTGFGFSWATGDSNCPEYPVDRLGQFGAVDQSQLKTVGDCKKLWPPCRAFGFRVHGALLSQAEVMAQLFPQFSHVKVLVGSHSPVGEMAARDDFPRLKEADMIEYHVGTFGREQWHMETLAYLPCPEAPIARLDGTTRLDGTSRLG